MIYRIFFLWFGLICGTGLVVNAQDFKEVLQHKEPIDRFNFIIFYYQKHLNEPKTISSFKTFLQEKGTKDDLYYFDYYAFNTQYYFSKVSFSKMHYLLDSCIKEYTKQKKVFLLKLI